MSPLEKHILTFVHRNEINGAINNYKFIIDRGCGSYEGTFEDFMENCFEVYLGLIKEGFLEAINYPNEYFPRLFLTGKAKKILEEGEK